MFRVTGGLVLLLALAGCATTADGESAGPTTPTTAATGAPAPATPSALSRTEAAQRYLAAVRPYNEALEDLEDAVNSGQPLATQQELAARTAEALAQETADLRAAAWPADVAPHIGTLVGESEQALPHWQRAAAAGSVEELVAAVNDATAFGGTDAAAAVRELLALDEYDEEDY